MSLKHPRASDIAPAGSVSFLPQGQTRPGTAVALPARSDSAGRLRGRKTTGAPKDAINTNATVTRHVLIRGCDSGLAQQFRKHDAGLSLSRGPAVPGLPCRGKQNAAPPLLLGTRETETPAASHPEPPANPGDARGPAARALGVAGPARWSRRWHPPAQPETPRPLPRAGEEPKFMDTLNPFMSTESCKPPKTSHVTESPEQREDAHPQCPTQGCAGTAAVPDPQVTPPNPRHPPSATASRGAQRSEGATGDVWGQEDGDQAGSAAPALPGTQRGALALAAPAAPAPAAAASAQDRTARQFTRLSSLRAHRAGETEHNPDVPQPPRAARIPAPGWDCGSLGHRWHLACSATAARNSPSPRCAGTTRSTGRGAIP